MKGTTRTIGGSENLHEAREDLMTERDAHGVKVVRIVSYLFLPPVLLFLRLRCYTRAPE
jgi:hypothetical protein